MKAEPRITEKRLQAAIAKAQAAVWREAASSHGVDDKPCPYCLAQAEQCEKGGG